MKRLPVIADGRAAGAADNRNAPQTPRDTPTRRGSRWRLPLVVAGCLAALFTIGCLPTALRPLFGAEAQVFDSNLIGTWETDDEADKDQWVFQSGADQSYRLTISQGEDVGKFEARLGKVNDRLFLDLFPDGAVMEDGHHHWMYWVLLHPTHAFFEVRLKGDECRLKVLDLDKLVAWLKENPQATPHQIVEDERLLLTGTTAQLQDFVTERLKSPEAWEEMVLKRKR